MRYVSVLLCLFFAGCMTSEHAMTSEMSDTAESQFHETVAAHIAAIQARDLDALLATVTTGDSLTLIFPQGTTFHTRQEYVDFHEEWFADTGWSMEIEPVSSTVRGDLGIALVRTTYTDDAGPRQAMLALTFAHGRDGWRLVFDQNTRIVEG